MRVYFIVLLALISGFAWADPLSTAAERSNFQRTGRYSEVPTLCEAFAKKWPESVKLETFGESPEGRPMLALIVSRSGTLTPAEARKKGLPVVLVQGGIHAGEIDGKDAGFWALKDLLTAGDPALQNAVVVFVPVFNVDGHERFARWNRPNQNGPEEMGWRVTSQYLNLNRDYAKAEAPEMHAMLKLLERWDPILYVDLHATDGAQFQPDVAILIEPRFTGASSLQPLGKALLEQTMEQLSSQGSMPLSFYPSFRDHFDPASGFSNGAFTPRLSTGYWALRNRLTVLVETHSWKDYPTRVRVTRNTVVDLVRATADQGRGWLKAAAEADRENLAGAEVPLSFKTTDKKVMIDFPGYAYKWVPSEVSGARALVYDPSTPQDWRMPFYPEVVADQVVRAPSGGYVVPAAYAAWMSARLRLHGIRFERLSQSLDSPLEVFRAGQVTYDPKPLEGRHRATLAGHWTEEKQSLPPGCLFVPIAQPKARLVMALLEPQAPDSYAAWGYFNSHFEQKEYMESYVAEQVGKEMLAKDPRVAAEFQRRLKSDPEFAQSPSARLDFFYRLHPSWDRQKNLYPIRRTGTRF